MKARLLKLLMGTDRYVRWANKRQWEVRGQASSSAEEIAPCFKSLYADLATLCSAHADGGALLEYGCGTGPLLKEIRDQGFRGALYGTDFASSQLEKAAARCPDAVITQADITSLPFKDKQFAVAVGVGVLMYLPPTGFVKAVEELKRVSQLVVAIEYDHEFLDDGMKRRFSAATDGRFAHDYAGVFKSSGFEIIKHERVEAFWNPDLNPTGAMGFGMIFAAAKP